VQAVAAVRDVLDQACGDQPGQCAGSSRGHHLGGRDQLEVQALRRERAEQMEEPARAGGQAPVRTVEGVTGSAC
jgi:hypothetical protein